jgi:2-amino-4-hydroxy-6-hydroxymethyldihydropteridine diphosphokinase
MTVSKYRFKHEGLSGKTVPTAYCGSRRSADKGKTLKRKEQPVRMILIALGSNLSSAAGTPAQTIAAAVVALKPSGITVVKSSQVYGSQAWPDASDPPFANAVAEVTTALPPAALLQALHGIEESFGRMRGPRNAPRTLDLDILDYDGRVESGPPELPHPRMETRPFVLVPLAEVAPDWRHPVSGRTVGEMLKDLGEADSDVAPLSSTETSR